MLFTLDSWIIVLKGVYLPDNVLIWCYILGPDALLDPTVVQILQNITLVKGYSIKHQSPSDFYLTSVP